MASQLYAFYSKALEVRELESIIGDESLSSIDKLYLTFGTYFEKNFIGQQTEDRSFEDSINIGWKLISIFPKDQVIRVKREYIESYYIPNFNPEDQF